MTPSHSEPPHPITSPNIQVSLPVYSPQIVTPNSVALLSTNISSKFSKEYVLIIKKKICENNIGNNKFKDVEVLGGVIDSDYEGEIKIIVFNKGKENVNVEKGDLIGVAKGYEIYCEENSNKNEISEKRGSLGFGSTGVL